MRESGGLHKTYSGARLERVFTTDRPEHNPILTLPSRTGNAGSVPQTVANRQMESTTPLIVLVEYLQRIRVYRDCQVPTSRYMTLAVDGEQKRSSGVWKIPHSHYQKALGVQTYKGARPLHTC